MKLKLCNVHRLALADEGEARKPIHIPFGTWAYDDTLDQTLDREHAEKIANSLKEMIAKGEPGIPVYQGHPDVPEYAGKYPDKGALGWVKNILVNEDGMDLEVEWDRDPGKGFGWFSPYWEGNGEQGTGNGKRTVVIDGLNSIGLVNNPNIREFRLANELPDELPTMKDSPKLPPFLVELAERFDKRKSLANVVDANGMGHGDDGKFDGSGSGGGGGSGSVDDVIKSFSDNDEFAQSVKDAIKDGVYSKDPEKLRKQLKHDLDPDLAEKERQSTLDALFNSADHRKEALANVTDANGRDHVDAGSPEGGQFAPGTGTATSAHGKDQLNAKTADGSSWHDANISNRIFHHVPNKWNAHPGLKAGGYKDRDTARHNINAILKQSRDDYHRATIYGRKNSDSKALKGDALEGKRNELRTQQAIHRVAILHGFKYNRATHQYE